MYTQGSGDLPQPAHQPPDTFPFTLASLSESASITAD